VKSSANRGITGGSNSKKVNAARNKDFTFGVYSHVVSSTLSLAISLVLSVAAGSPGEGPAEKNVSKKMKMKEELVLGSGCFWCLEAIFDDLVGVDSAVAGYAGGTAATANYRDVSAGGTGHAEVLKVTFDSTVIAAEDILRVFFTFHDPTQLNRQGNDYGTHYRSAIFYANDAQKQLAQKVMEEIRVAKIYPGKIVTTLEPLNEFFVAEDYHQDYFARYEQATEEERAKMNSGYCNAVIGPKVAKFRKTYASRLKTKSG
jgi:peptide-methionine (S)-S-oxide reductase